MFVRPADRPSCIEKPLTLPLLEHCCSTSSFILASAMGTTNLCYFISLSMALVLAVGHKLTNSQTCPPLPLPHHHLPLPLSLPDCFSVDQYDISCSFGAVQVEHPDIALSKEHYYCLDDCNKNVHCWHAFGRSSTDFFFNYGW